MESGCSCSIHSPPLAPRLRHLHCDLDRFQHTLFARFARAGDIKGGAMINRGANDGQTHADVDAAVKGQQLHGDVALVMVHGDDNVIVAFDGAQEDRVGRLGIGDLQATIVAKCDFQGCY